MCRDGSCGGRLMCRDGCHSGRLMCRDGCHSGQLTSHDGSDQLGCSRRGRDGYRRCLRLFLPTCWLWCCCEWRRRCVECTGGDGGDHGGCRRRHGGCVFQGVDGRGKVTVGPAAQGISERQCVWRYIFVAKFVSWRVDFGKAHRTTRLHGRRWGCTECFRVCKDHVYRVYVKKNEK